MNAHNCHCTDEYRGHLSDSPWRGALTVLASPMVRLHNLRNLRTRMLHDALGDVDDCNARGEDA